MTCFRKKCSAGALFLLLRLFTSAPGSSSPNQQSGIIPRSLEGRIDLNWPGQDWFHDGEFRLPKDWVAFLFKGQAGNATPFEEQVGPELL